MSYRTIRSFDGDMGALLRILASPLHGPAATTAPDTTLRELLPESRALPYLRQIAVDMAYGCQDHENHLMPYVTATSGDALRDAPRS